MKTFLLTLLAGLLLFVNPAPAAPASDPIPATVASEEVTTFQIDPAHTTIGFRIRHMGIAFVEGEFDAFEGTITYDPNNVAATRADVTVQTASIDTDVQQRDDHLRSADFFEVESYPTMTFTTTEVQPTGQHSFRLIGDLTIKGTTKEVALDIEDLLERSTAPSEIIAAVRSPEKAADLAARGVEVREADYTKPDTLETAFEGARRLLLISSNEVGQRFAHHRNVVEAAQKAGVGFIAYTSLVRADTNPMMLAAEHKATEEFIRASGISFVFLRNGWYTENYTEQLPHYLEFEGILGSAGEGRVSAATRADYAAAAAAVLTGEGHESAVYELGGDDAFTMAELAAEISRQSGTEVAYGDVPAEEHEDALVGFGLPEPYAAVLADADRAVANGHLLVETSDLRRLIGRPTTPLADAVADALADVLQD